jgi:hypothetical protein
MADDITLKCTSVLSQLLIPPRETETLIIAPEKQ